MNCDEEDNSGVPPAPRDDESRSAVNSIVLDYYKKFGKKRDLEQYFSLSTAQNDIRDPSSMFWSRMKAETESSDSGERSDKKSDSSQELCRISIRFPAVDSCTPKEEDSKSKIESVSPPIIIEEISQDSRQNSDDDDAMKSDDNHSQKSYDVLLDTSINKLHSPSSSITSQRKLEWDSLADVGYANESDRKTSASSLSTLERLALKQQYSNNDTQQNSSLGLPASHSTPLDENEAKSKIKKGVGKKSTKISKKDVDFLEVNVPHSSNMNPTQSINVNLTKHISFNVEKDGKVTVDNVQKDVSVSPEKASVETEIDRKLRVDKEIQTSLTKSKETNVLSHIPENIQVQSQPQRIPILISLNTLRNRVRRKKLRKARRKLKSKKRADKENIPVQEKSGEQLSEAESFEYMPGHIYNQNKMSANDRPPNAAGNKSSLESSGVLTTDSSKGSSHSFTKDLEKSIDLLRAALQGRCDDSALRKQLVKQVCQRLITSKYRDDESTTDFLSGLSFSSKKLGLGERNNTTTSTSDANNSTEKSKRPKKSILRTDKFNPAAIASTSQSVPNLPVASKSEIVVTSNLAKNLTTSNTDSDISGKEKSSSDNMFAKTSSEELYQKYLQALKREEAYKRHLKDKEMFLKQKLVSSDSAFKVPVTVEVKPKPNNRLKDLINDLTRNNYDDGSGDASKLEGGPGSNTDFDRYIPNRNQRSHSVFTLSSGNSDGNNKKPNLKKRLQCDIKDLSSPGPSKDKHYCCCPHHSRNLKVGVTDSSVQVNIKNPCSEESCPARQKTLVNIATNEGPYKDSPKIISDDATGDIRYVCLCSHKVSQEVPDNFLIYKCSRLTNQGVQLEEPSSKAQVFIPCNELTCDKKKLQNVPCTFIPPVNKSSQTNMLLKMSNQTPIETTLTCLDDKKLYEKDDNKMSTCDEISTKGAICEATRWIQTEISINPKISEPTLSDINIVSDTNCAKLVCEFSREPSKPSLTEVYSHQPQSNAKCASSGSYNSSGTLKDMNNEAQGDIFLDAKVKSKKENTESKEMNVEHSDNFTIPIQGTNMTLMVSIGSERMVPGKKKNEIMFNQGVETDRVNAIEQATCLTEECSKGVQADKLACGFETDRNNKLTETVKNLCTINRFADVEDPKFDTYPKKSPVNELKLLQRSNTDTAMVDEVQIKRCKCGCSHIEGPCKGNCADNILDSTEKLSYKSTRSNIDQVGAVTYSGKLLRNLSDKQSENNCYGYGESKDSCKEDYDQRKSTPKEHEPFPEKDIPLQVDVQSGDAKDISDKNRESCSCGCGSTKNNCRNICTEAKSATTSTQQCMQSTNKQKTNRRDYNTDVLSQKFKEKPCVTQAVGKQISTQNTATATSKVCSSGCDGIKKDCKEDCKENKKLSLDNTQGSDESIQNKQSECPCGCGGTKDSCKEDCIELKSTPKESNKIQSTEKKESCKKKPINKEISTQKDYPDEQKCHCGCGGLKGKCKKSCKGFKISPRKQYKKQPIVVGLVGDDKEINTSEKTSELQKEKCFCGCGGIKENCKNDCSKIPCDKQIDKKEVGTQKDQGDSPRNFKENDEESKTVTRRTETQNTPKNGSFNKATKKVNSHAEQTDLRSSDNDRKSTTETEQTDTDPILNMIHNITKKYSKNEIERNKRKKCFKEIITVLNYLLETDDTAGLKEGITCESTTSDETDDSIKKVSEKTNTASAKNVLDKSSTCREKVPKKLVDKGVQLSSQKTKSQPCTTESSDLPASTDIPGTSSDSATCKVLNKIKKECERYHQKRCKIHNAKKCDGTSSTSMNCDQCNRVHHCTCRSHKCKGHKKMNEKMQKGSVAYNLILQTSESMVSESPRGKTRLLKNIIVKVPKKKHAESAPFREIHCTATDTRSCRSRSLPNESEISSMEEIIRKSQGATVREYLEKNRPDFIDRSSQRQSCLKYISESRATERAIKRDLLSLHVAQLPDVTALNTEDLRRLAKDLGRHMRQKQPVPKLISEREMKKHSEKIYKSLPEVVQKKEEKIKENIKKTNLLMANMFKKNLQKKTLRGSVNLSNYSTVIKI